MAYAKQMAAMGIYPDVEVAPSADVTRMASSFFNALVVKEAEGHKLFLSSKSETGYKGVGYHWYGGKFQGYSGSGPGNSGGTYDTAVEAAVAYAKPCGAGHPSR